MLAERASKPGGGIAVCYCRGTLKSDESVLWDDVVVEPDARVRRAVLGDGVRIKAGES